MAEPGLDRHEWETEWAALEPLVVDAPEEALPEVDRLIGRMLVEVGYPLDDGAVDPTAQDGIDPDVLATYLAAHSIARRVDGANDVSAEDVTEAVRLFRELYEHLLAREIDV